MELFDRVLTVFDGGDSFQAAEVLDGDDDPLAIAKRYSELIGWLYGKKRVFAMCAFGRIGVHRCLLEARRVAAENEALAGELKGWAKTIAYNVSSNLWPGWNDEGIVITPADLVWGLDLARFNLRLGRELKKGAEPMGNGHWLVGAHDLAAGRHAVARASFVEAAKSFTAAGKPDFTVMAEGYVALANHLANDPAGDRQLNDAVTRLRDLGTDDGRFFADQIETAKRVLSGEPESGCSG